MLKSDPMKKTLNKEELDELRSEYENNEIYTGTATTSSKGLINKVTFGKLGEPKVTTAKEVIPKPSFIKCDNCYMHLLEVNYEAFYDEFGYIYLSFWDYCEEEYTWKEVFKKIWQLLTKKRIVIREFVLTSETKEELIKALNIL